MTTGAARDPVFAAAASYFGVGDLSGFAATTHDFESRYLDGLIGPLPGFEAIYLERAPVGHVTDATCPVLLLQGLDDPVVPPQQSESIAAELAAHGIRHAYIAVRGRVARVQEGRERHRLAGGGAVVLRPDPRLHAAWRGAAAGQAGKAGPATLAASGKR